MISQFYLSLVFIFRLLYKYDCNSNSPGGESSDKPYVLEKYSGKESDCSLSSRSTISFLVISFLVGSRKEI